MKIKKLAILPLALLTLTGCENYKVVGNRMETGSYTYNYCFVQSEFIGNKYYHIKGWKEYDPEGGTLGRPYVGLELHLFSSGDVVYYYEMGLNYVFMKNYNADFGNAIE